MEEVVDLELIAYNKRKYAMMKQTHKIKKANLDTSILCTIEEPMIDTKKTRFNDLLSVGIAISYATMDKAKAKA
jgi:hypothetical protein